MIYLDNAATTFPKPNAVWDEMDRINRTCSVNAGRGSYELARRATGLIDETKKRIVNLVHLQDASKVILTPSVTIAINQVLNGVLWEKNDVIYVSPYEHNAIARTAELIKNKYDVKVIEMPINEETLEIDLEALSYMFTISHPKCVCINCISNVTGYILPVNEILREAKKYDSITILDTAQSLGLIEMDLRKSEADFIVFAGHKTLYGPFGIGGFIYNCQYCLEEYIVGGTGSDSLNLQMPSEGASRYESSSPNIVAIAGLNAALKWREEINDIEEKERALTKYAISKLKLNKGIKLYVPQDEQKHVGIISLNIPGYKADDVGMILDQDFEISVRTGYHCAPYIHKWLRDEPYHGTVRISIGYFNTMEEIERLVEALHELVEEV